MDVRPALPAAQREAHRPGRASCWSSSTLSDAGRPGREDLLRRHAPPARPGRGADRPPAGDVPGRADHRARPAQPASACGRSSATWCATGYDAAADHAVPGGGRRAGRRHRGRRPRQDHRPRHRRRAQGPGRRASGSRSSCTTRDDLDERAERCSAGCCGGRARPSTRTPAGSPRRPPAAPARWSSVIRDARRRRHRDRRHRAAPADPGRRVPVPDRPCGRGRRAADDDATSSAAEPAAATAGRAS